MKTLGLVVLVACVWQSAWAITFHQPTVITTGITFADGFSSLDYTHAVGYVRGSVMQRFAVLPV